MRGVARSLEFAYHVFMLLLLTGAFLPLWREMTVGRADPLEGDPLVRGILLGGYLVGLALLVPKLRLLPSVVRRTPLLWLLVLWAGLSVLWSVEPEVSLRRWVSVVLLTLYALALALRYEFTGWLRLLLWVGVINLVGSLLVSVFLPEWGVRPEPRGEPWRGWFVEKNLLGRAAVLFLIPLLFAYLSERTAHLKGMSTLGFARFGGLLIFVVPLLFLLYKSDSKASWVMAVSTVVFFLLIRFGRKLRRMWPVYLVGLTLFAVSGLVATTQYAEEVAGLLGRDLTLTGRTGLWGTAWDFIMYRPLLGYGLGAFWSSESYGGVVSAWEGWRVPHAHNGFLDLWLDLGFGAFALGTFILISLLLTSWGMYIKTGSSEAAFWSVVSFYLTIYNLVESAFFRVNLFTWLFIVMAQVRLVHLQGQVFPRTKVLASGAVERR
ncbi:MAG: O-antigen ligase family protein [Candidatus Hadarchaeales archaeon]